MEEMRFKILDLLGFPVKPAYLEKEWTPVYHYLENHSVEETEEHFGPIIQTIQRIYASKGKRLVRSRVNNPKEYLNTRWYNPNEEAEFVVDDAFDGLYELSYDTNPKMVDYREVYEFDNYIQENECKKVAKRLVANNLVNDIKNTLEKKNLDTSFLNDLQSYNDKQISFLTSIKYGLNGYSKLDDNTFNKLMQFISPFCSVEQMKSIIKLINRNCTDEQIKLVLKYDLEPEEISIVYQNFFQLNESIEQTEAWIERYLVQDDFF